MRRRFLTTKKVFLALIFLTGFGGMGMTYSAWTASGVITSGLNTGKFSMIFPEPDGGNYTFAIADGEGNLLEELDADVLVEEDGKKAGIRFRSGLPVELLAEGNYIRIEYPLEPAADATLTAIEITEADLEGEGERIRMDAKSGALVMDGNILEDSTALEPFLVPLEFYVYRETAKEPGVLSGTMLLRLTEESLQQVSGMPETVELGAEDLEEAGSDGLFVDEVWEGSGETAEPYGVVVTYTCEITFYLNQKEAGTEKSGGWEDG